MHNDFPVWLTNQLNELQCIMGYYNELRSILHIYTVWSSCYESFYFPGLFCIQVFIKPFKSHFKDHCIKAIRFVISTLKHKKTDTTKNNLLFLAIKNPLRKLGKIALFFSDRILNGKRCLDTLKTDAIVTNIVLLDEM